MALTRPTLNNILTNVVAFADPITVLHAGATSANVDVGFLFNRANGLVSNVAIYWSESAQSFVTAFTANTGVTDSNVTPTSYANLTIGNLLMVNGSILNVTGNINANTVGTHYGNVSATGNVSTSGNVYASSFFYSNGTPFTSSSYGNVQMLANLAAGSNPVTFGSNIVAASGTASISTSTGALVVTGGAGIAGNVFAGNAYLGNGLTNYVTVAGGVTGNAAIISTAGSDANVALLLQSKGTTSNINLSTNTINVSNGGTVTGVTRTAGGSGYTTAITATISAPTTAGGVQATATAYTGAIAAVVANGGTGYALNDVITVAGGTGTQAQTFTVTGVSGGAITSVAVQTYGYYTVLPTNPVSVTGGTGSSATLNLSNFSMTNIAVATAGSGYVEQPTVTFSGGGSGAGAYATVGGTSTLKSLGYALNFGTSSGTGFAVADAGANATYWWQAIGGASNGILRSTGASQSGLIQSQGTGSIYLQTNSGAQTQFVATHTASAVNYLQVTGAATGGRPTISAQGSDATVGIAYTTKGTGTLSRHAFTTGSGTQFLIVDSSTGSVNTLQVTGSASGSAPVLASQGADTNIDINLKPAGTGNVQTTSPLVITNANVSTSTGTGALVVSGGAGIAGNLNVGGNVVITGNLSITGNLTSVNYETVTNTEYVTALVATTVNAATIGNSGATLTGTLSTAAQPNITSVGTLTSLAVGTSLTVDNGSYGNVVATQFGSVFATAYGPNNYAILQAWSPATGGALGLNAYGNIVYSSGAINFKTGATIRDKDYPTGGTNGVQIAANGAVIASTGIASTSTGTGAVIVTGGVGVSGNVVSPNFYGNISPTPGLSTIYTTGHVVPTANVVYDLGTNANRFRSLYLSGSTIYLGNATITTTSTGDIVINNTGSFAVPVGTTDQRSAVQGAIRYNTTLSSFESYDGTTWNKLAYGTVSDFPDGDYGDLTVLTDAFGVSTSTTYDCNASGAIVTSDLEAAGDTALSPI